MLMYGCIRGETLFLSKANLSPRQKPLMENSSLISVLDNVFRTVDCASCWPPMRLVMLSLTIAKGQLA